MNTHELASHAYHYFLDRNPTDDERSDLVSVGLGREGYLLADERYGGRFNDKPILLFYTSCHADQLTAYLRIHRPDIMEKFQLVVLYTHRLLLHRGKFNLQLVHAIFAKAHTIVTNPMNPKFEELSTIPLLAQTKAAVVQFVPPCFAAFWPVVEYFGEQPVAYAMLKGQCIADIQTDFLDGKLECKFTERYMHQIARLKEREKACDVRIADFINTHLKTHKLFFTGNHPTFTLITHIMERCLEKLGYDSRGLDWTLSVGVNEAKFADHFPETKYEWDYYGFEYPIRWPEDRGGNKFYLDAISTIYRRMTDPRKVINEPLTQVEIEV